MQAVKIIIPDGLEFAALHLSRDPITGDLEFDWSPIESICAASGLDIAMFHDAPEDNVCALLTAWYMEHRARGGAIDLVQEQIIAEVQAEDALGAERVQAGPGTRQ
ncbi:MAG: hypothetical protein AB1450_08395 [Pseudomonadota bacterium]